MYVSSHSFWTLSYSPYHQAYDNMVPPQAPTGLGCLSNQRHSTIMPHFLVSSRDQHTLNYIDESGLSQLDGKMVCAKLNLSASVSGELIRYLHERPDEKLSCQDLMELGFTTGDAHDEKDGNMYQVKRVAYRQEDDGARGYFVASSVTRGNWDSFWIFKFYTISSNRMCTEVIQWSGVSSKFQSTVVTSEFGVKLVQPPYLRAKMADELLKWCKSHPNRFINIYSPGNREISSNHTCLYHNTVKVYCRSIGGECMRAAVANGLYSFSEVDAKKFIEIGRINDERFGEINNQMVPIIPQYVLERVQLVGEDADDWLLRQTSGVYIAITQGKDDVGDLIEHAVTVNADGQYISDCCETRAFKLSHRALYASVGNATYERVVDFRRLRKREVAQNGKSKKKKSKSLTVQTIKKRERKRMSQS